MRLTSIKHLWQASNDHLPSLKLDDLKDPRLLYHNHVLTEFHRWLYNRCMDERTHPRWLGVKLQKSPLDLWTYQEMIWADRPSLIIETGTMHGGSALYLASVIDLIGEGRVLSIDIEKRDPLPQHERIEYLSGRSSTDPSLLDEVREAAEGKRVMAILDSDHSMGHVLAELDAYGPLVSAGCHLVVEDTDVNGHPMFAEFGPGPWEALEAWLPHHPEFERVDLDSRFLVSMHPRGFLKRLP